MLETQELVRTLRTLLSADQISTKPADLEQASRDESSFTSVRPDVVIWPTLPEDVGQVIRLAYERGVPVTPRSGGSSLEGNAIPVQGGIVLDFRKMNRIVEILPDDLLVRVQPGVIYRQLSLSLRKHGLFFPPSPGGSSDVATVGGMVANNASGIYSVKYGGTRDYVLQLEVVTGQGERLKLGSLCRKSSSGYHLLGLMIGSEGTLGIITEVTLRLVGLPESQHQQAFVFPSEQSAASACSTVMRYGLDVAALEFMDGNTIQALNTFGDYGLIEAPMLFLEVHGAAGAVDETMKAIDTICGKEGEEVVVESGGVWEIRHHATAAVLRQKPEAHVTRMDVAFPVSALPSMVAFCQQLARKEQVPIFTFGHAGLGILHILMLFDPKEKARDAQGNAVREAIVKEALQHGGTISGEHGIGVGNKAFMPLEHGPALDLMRELKAIFDPKGILNPGKIFD